MIQHIKRHFILLVNIVLVLTASAMTVDEVPNVHLASRARYVSNPSGVLSESAVSSLDAAIARLWDKTSVEMVVVAIDRIDPSMTPEEFATALFEKWGIGKSGSGQRAQSRKALTACMNWGFPISSRQGRARTV